MHAPDTTPWLVAEPTTERRATIRHPGPCTLAAMAAAAAIVGFAATAHAQSSDCQRLGAYTHCDYRPSPWQTQPQPQWSPPSVPGSPSYSNNNPFMYVPPPPRFGR